MKTEYSAGGVVVRHHTAVWEILLICDMNSSWTFPKGMIEKGEDAIQAATREIQEEVGIRDLTFVCPLSTISYTFRRRGVIHKTVDYFLFTSKGKETLVAQKEEGISDVRWVSMAEARNRIGYKETNMQLLRQAYQNLRVKHISKNSK